MEVTGVCAAPLRPPPESGAVPSNPMGHPIQRVAKFAKSCCVLRRFDGDRTRPGAGFRSLAECIQAGCIDIARQPYGIVPVRKGRGAITGPGRSGMTPSKSDGFAEASYLPGIV